MTGGAIYCLVGSLRGMGVDAHDNTTIRIRWLQTALFTQMVWSVVSVFVIQDIPHCEQALFVAVFLLPDYFFWLFTSCWYIEQCFYNVPAPALIVSFPAKLIWYSSVTVLSIIQ